MRGLLGAAFLACTTVPASAAVTVYATRDDFLAAAGSTATETFNSVTSTKVFTNSTVQLAGLSLTGSSTGVGEYIYTASSGAVDGTNYADITVRNFDPRTDQASVTITFATPTYAFGADFVGLSDTGLTTTITAGSTTLTPTTYSGSDARFYGFVSDQAFNSVTFRAVSGKGDEFKMDNVTYSASVPEPATWAMMLLGFGFVGAGLRRRRGSEQPDAG